MQLSPSRAFLARHADCPEFLLLSGRQAPKDVARYLSESRCKGTQKSEYRGYGKQSLTFVNN